LAVLSSIVVESRRYSGWLDPRYPIGYWWAGRGITGDATGGVLGIDLIFQIATAAILNSQLYSVERAAVRSNDETSRVVRLSAVNMAGPQNAGFTNEYTVPIVAAVGVGSSAMSAEAMALFPWFLGSARLPSITASFSMVADNVDTVAFIFEAEGYRWSPRSVLADGGPQRPPTGPYRS